MKKIILTLMTTILLVLSACAGNSVPQSATNDPNEVMTVVASTMSAMSSPTPEATLTNIPTLAPIATATPAPTTLRVVYSRAGEIWIWNQGGEPLKLSNSGIDIQPRISSDGKIVVFARNNELYAVNSDGSNLRKIVSKEYLNPYRPKDHKWIWAEHYDWMLDTHILYFTTVAQVGCKDCPDYPYYQFDLHRVDLDKGDVSMVLPAGQGGVPYFSPNGQTMAIASLDSISLANVDGSNWRIGLSFEPVSTYSEWFYIPVVVPLPDASGFRVSIPAFHDPQGYPDESSEFWDIPLMGKPVILHTYLQFGFPYQTLSPSGNSIVFSRKEANGAFSLCLYHHDVVQEICVPVASEKVYATNWATDESKYTFQTSNQVLVESNYVFETKDYIASALEPSNVPVETDGDVWLTWVNSDQYLYIDEERNLKLGIFGRSSTTIHNGVKNPAGKDGILPFDFSTR